MGSDANEIADTPASLAPSMTLMIVSATAFSSAWITTEPWGLSASIFTTLALTCLTSILLPSIQISPVAPTAIKIAAFSWVSAVSESGLFISKPGSLIKFAVTIKKVGYYQF